MSITTEEELRALRAAGEAVSRVLQAMKQEVRPGVTTAELDEVGAALLWKWKPVAKDLPDQSSDNWC